MKKRSRVQLDTASKINLGNVLLSHTLKCSTIAAEGLNFRVRDGNGCTPFAKVTKKLYKIADIEYGLSAHSVI